MSDLAVAQEKLSRARAAFEMRPDCRDRYVDLLEWTVRMLRVENRELRRARSARRPIIIRRAA